MSRFTGQPESRSRLVFNVYVYAMQETKRSKSITFLTRYRSGGTPLHQHRTCVPKALRAVARRDQGQPQSWEIPGSTVLPVAARRWVSDRNTAGRTKPEAEGWGNNSKNWDSPLDILLNRVEHNSEMIRNLMYKIDELQELVEKLVGNSSPPSPKE